MRPTPDATVLRHRLRVRLRQARTDADLTQREVAERLGWSTSKVLRIESGQIGVSRGDLRELLQLYGVTGTAEVAELVQIARQSRRQPWGDYRDVLHPEYLVYLRYELAASRIRDFHPHVVPGLLQTRAYARQLIRRFAPRDTPESTLERQLEVRMARQAILDGDDGPRATFLIGEAAVRRAVGAEEHGRQILRDQLQRLTELATHPAITIQILPFNYPIQDGMLEPFTLLDLAATGERLLYLDGIRGSSAVRHDTDQTERYDDLFSQLAEAATNQDEIATFLDKLIP